MYIVYMHISPSNKRYVGITSNNVKRRWNNGRGYSENKYFTNAIKKYGWNNFEHIIIAKGLSKDEAKWLEIELIRELDLNNRDKGYNITKGGEGTKGISPRDYMTEEAKIEHDRKISEALKGRKCSEEHKQRVSEALKGRKRSEEHRKNLSKALKGKREGKNHPMYGKHHTEESIKKMSKTRIEKGLSKGKNNPVAKSVICLTTKRIFYTNREGAKYYNCNDSNIIKCCKGKTKSAGKLPDGTPLVWRKITWKHNKILRPIDNKFKRVA